MGRSTRGEFSGCYVLVTPETEDTYYFYVSDSQRVPAASRRTDDFAVRNENLETVLDELGVEWLDVSEDESMEIEVFDLRSHWHALRARRRKQEKILGVLAKFFPKPSGPSFRPN